MAASESELGNLHDKVARTLSKMLDGQKMPDYIDPETGEAVEGNVLEPSAAVITASIQFLKNNNITCTPSKDNGLGELEQKMRERQEKRANRAKPSAVDLASASEQATWLGGTMGNA